jgi:Sec-independent protein translocase protein TatA
MFDVSWGETFVLIGISMSIIGRKDLPKASRFLGHQVGKLVGILQGARARADLFAQNNELQALQNELRSGLRELDVVKGELAVAASSRGLIGRGLGSTISSSSSSLPLKYTDATATGPATAASFPNATAATVASFPNTTAATAVESVSSDPNGTAMTTLPLAPRSQSVAAVAEEEWEKRGIGFKSNAERGTGFYGSNPSYNPVVGIPSSLSTAGTIYLGGGSALLSDFIQQNLIHDQYDRAVMEQDREIQEKMERTRMKRSMTESSDENTKR